MYIFMLQVKSLELHRLEEHIQSKRQVFVIANKVKYQSDKIHTPSQLNSENDHSTAHVRNGSQQVAR